jgi:cytochrome c5
MKSIKNNAAKVLSLVLIAMALTANAVTDKQQTAIEERIKPVGQLCLEGDTSCGAAVVATASAAQSPEDIFNGTCTACHTAGVAGAPKVGDIAAWSPRLANGIDAVYANAINGLNTMPAKGLCVTCSDDDIKATVDFMVEQSQ